MIFLNYLLPKLRLLFTILVLQYSFFIKAQQTVTTIYGDNGGFFTSSTGAINTYNDSNNLLGFTVEGVTYSTGVNDATLTSNGITHTTGRYFSFPMPANISYNSQELIGIGSFWGGVAQNNNAGDYIKTFSPIVPSFFVRDGNKGLELATNFFNIKSQVITYDAIVINQATSINDAKPDILVTQTGAPGSTDKFKFIDINGNIVGSELNVVFGGVSKVSRTFWTIYRVNPVTGLVNSLFGANTPRDLRALTFKLSDFGITTTNFSQITNFVHTTSGNTDIAFTAYNLDSVEIIFDPADLEVSNSTIIADDFCAPTTATFTTIITNNSTELAKDFEVEFQMPSSTTTVTSTNANFSSIGIPSTNATYNGLENTWTILELSAGESVTLTVNTSLSAAPFPISFTATASLLFQQDIVPSDNTLTVSETGNDSDCDGETDDNDLDDDNDGILDTVEGTGDFDGDGIPNYLDLDSDGDQCPDALEGGGSINESQLDSDYRITGGVSAFAVGVPSLVGSGQALGDSQDGGTKTCDNTDTDLDGYIDIVDLDDDNDGILDVDEGTGNTDGTGAIDSLDTDSDADGCPDALEGGANFTFADLDINNRLTGDVDNNGIPLVATSDGQTIGSSQDNGVESTTCSLLPVIISQVYQTATGNAIELTNIGATTANNIRVALFKDIGITSPSGVVPTSTLQITSLAAGSSVLIKSIGSIPSTTIINSPLEITDANFANITGGDDTIILSTTIDNTSWANRYDVISNIEDESSFVRVDEVTKANTTFTASEWINFMDDNIPVLGDLSPIPAITRHVNAPLLSEVKNPNLQSNNGLGLHRINPTIRISNVWSNGYPDKSRSVIIQENYEHSSSLTARKIDIQEDNTLTISNSPLIVVNNTNINDDATIRILGSGQFIQTHEGVSDVSGNGKLLLSQKSELPNTYRYNYWSSPVVEFPNGSTYRVSKILKDAGGDLTSASIISDIDFVDGFDGADGSPIKISNYWIWAFFDNKTRDDWVQLKETSYLDRGLGFTMKSTGENPQYFTFSGSPIDGDITFGITDDTTSLLGNPYAGTLDAHAFILNNENSITGTLYFWEHSGESEDFGHSRFEYEGGYAQLTFSMGTAANSIVTGISGLTPSYTYKTPSRYIAVGQGFFVTSDSDGGTIAFNNKQRSYQATEPDFFKGKSKIEITDKLSILKLGINFTNQNGLTIHRQLGISFNNKHTFNFDYGYESEMIDLHPTDAYWSFEEMDDKKLVIAGVEEIKDNLKVPISFTIDNDQPIFLRIDELKNVQNKIYLYDSVLKTSKELSTDNLLELEISKGFYEDRFFITFNENTVLNSESEISERNLDIYMNQKTNKITILNKANLFIEKVEAFNLLGQKIKIWKPSEQSTKIELEAGSLNTSIYMIKVKSDKLTIIKKILKE